MTVTGLTWQFRTWTRMGDFTRDTQIVLAVEIGLLANGLAA